MGRRDWGEEMEMETLIYTLSAPTGFFLMETVAWKYDCATRIGLEVK